MKEERQQLIALEYKRIIRNYYEEQYAKKFQNLDEMDKFLEKYNLPKLIEEEAESLNKPKTPDEIETVIKSFQYTKALDQMVSQENLQSIKGRVNPPPPQIISKKSRRWKTPKLVL